MPQSPRFSLGSCVPLDVVAQGEDEDSLKQDLENKTAGYSGLISEDFNERLREKSGKWKEGKEGGFFGRGERDYVELERGRGWAI